jgi:transposase
LDPLRKFVGTLRRHYDGVVAFVGTRLSNAIGEGLNRIVKIVKNRASGFRTLDAFTEDAFTDMIFLVVGDLDIPAQIPATFRTL